MEVQEVAGPCGANASAAGVPTEQHGSAGGPHAHVARLVLVTLSYVLGIAGNALALYMLRGGGGRARRGRAGGGKGWKGSGGGGSGKHALMLRCLAGNDLVALLGMLVQLYVGVLVPRRLLDQRLLCGARVLWRLFGLGSGCVAAVMALERWLALTHPFLYHKHVTVELIFVAIVGLWAHALVLVCLPFVGFGLYLDKQGRCERYRNATEPQDVAYAYLYFSFGTLLCFCIVWCNLAVVRALCHMDLGRGGGSASSASSGGGGRRISRQPSSSSSSLAVAVPAASKCSGGGGGGGGGRRGAGVVRCGCAACAPPPPPQPPPPPSTLAFNESTSEEVAFARLMTVLSVFFVVCWAPQMISILLAQFRARSRAAHWFFVASDLLMALHFTVDPLVYVVLRKGRGRGRGRRGRGRLGADSTASGAGSGRRRRCLPALKLACRRCSDQSQATNEMELPERPP